MSRGGAKKKNAQVRIAHLEIKKRNGIIVAVAAFVGLAVVIALKLTFQYQGVEWLNAPAANLSLFILAVICAGIAGWGTRAWRRARNEIQILERRTKK